MSPELTNGLFAIAGASIGALATWISTRNQVERRVLSVRYGDVENLLERIKASRLTFDLKLNDIPISHLFRQTAWVTNKGNRPIEKIMLPFNLFFFASIFDAFYYDAGRDGRPTVQIEKAASGDSILVHIDFLNVGEQVRIDFVLDDYLENKISCPYRVPGVNFKESYGEDQRAELLKLSYALLPRPIALIGEVVVSIFAKK